MIRARWRLLGDGIIESVWLMRLGESHFEIRCPPPPLYLRRGWVNAVESVRRVGGDGLNHSVWDTGVFIVSLARNGDPPTTHTLTLEKTPPLSGHGAVWSSGLYSALFLHVSHTCRSGCMSPPSSSHTCAVLPNRETTLCSTQPPPPPPPPPPPGTREGFQHLPQQLTMDSSTKSQWSSHRSDAWQKPQLTAETPERGRVRQEREEKRKCSVDYPLKK